MSNYLYRHFNKENQLLYVGVSLNAFKRVSEHKNSSHWFCEIFNITLERFENMAQALEAETLAIKNENPLYNIRKNKKFTPHSVGEDKQINESRQSVIKRIVEIRPVYTIKEIKDVLPYATINAINKLMDDGELGYFEVPNKNGTKNRRLCTGFQLINYLEFVQCKDKNKTL